MEIVCHKIAIPKGQTEIIVAPLGDIQFAGVKEELAWNRLLRFRDEALERGAWFLGTGDMTDFMSPSNRARYEAAGLYDTAKRVINDKARELCDVLLDELLAPTKGRWLGMVEGHHYAHLVTGETTDQYLCAKLHAPFLGTSAYVGLSFDTPVGNRTVTLWVHHGEGGGQSCAAPVNKLEGLANAWEGVDVMLVGHMSKKASASIQRQYPVWGGRKPTSRDREVHLVGVGGWLKGWQPGSRQGNTPRGNYVEKRMLKPVAIGSPFIRIRAGIRREDMLQKGGMDERFWEPEIRVET